MFDAVRFSQLGAFSLRHAIDFLNLAKDHFKWKESEEILDLGCADGNLTKTVLYPFVQQHLGQLYGCDKDGDAVDIAIKRHTTEKISFAKMDAEDDQSAEENQNKFDHIFAFYLLHWVSVQRWPNNLFKMTKTGGQLFSSIFLAPNPLTKTLEKLKSDTNKSWFPYFEACPSIFTDYGTSPIETISYHLKKAGFVVDMINVIDVEQEFPSAAVLLDVTMSSHMLEGLLVPQEIYKEYCHDFSKELIRHVQPHGQGYLAKTQSLIFVASKP